MRELQMQENLFGEVESPYTAKDYLVHAEDKLREWLKDGKVPAQAVENQSDMTRVVIAIAYTYTAMFLEECMKRSLDAESMDDMRLMFMEVLGNPRQLSSETFNREYRKLREV